MTPLVINTAVITQPVLTQRGLMEIISQQQQCYASARVGAEEEMLQGVVDGI